VEDEEEVKPKVKDAGFIDKLVKEKKQKGASGATQSTKTKAKGKGAQTS
jgi:hypothetical protein